jgi:MFS superfamily sulfate permease-like transporter
LVTATPTQRQLEPKLLVTLREGVSARQLAQDVLAGVIVGIVAHTPIAGIVHAATLLGIVLAFGHQAERIPICALAGFLLVVAHDKSEWRLFVRLFRSPRASRSTRLTAPPVRSKQASRLRISWAESG